MGFTDRFKNATNPSKWKVTGDDVKSGVAAYLTMGGSLAAQEAYDKGDPTNAIRAAWEDVTGKTAADKAAKSAAAAKAAQIAAGQRGQAFTQEQMASGRADIQAGTQQAADAIYGGTAGGLGALYGGQGQAAEALGSGTSQSLAALYGGQDQAAGALQGSPNRLADLYSGGYDALAADPGYQFRLKQGLEGVNNAAAARGGRHGGDTLKALAEYNQGFASNEMQNAFQRAGMADQADFGRSSALAGLYQGTGQQAAGIQGQHGNSLAGLYAGTGQQAANIYTGTGSQLANIYGGQGQQLAGIGMQGAGINAGITQASMGALAPQQTQQNPSGMQQLVGLGAMAAGTYFGGPAGGMAAKQAVTNMQQPTVQTV